jgi:hypothetical protein
VISSIVNSPHPIGYRTAKADSHTTALTTI